MSILRALVLSSLVFAHTLAIGAVTTTVVDVPTRGITQRFLYLMPDAPVANIVMLPGGDGVLGIRDDGTMNVTSRCGPVVRNRQAYAEHGFALALVDAASNGSVGNFADVLEVIRYMQGRNNVPTWLIGGSSSTESIRNVSVNLPADSPVGVIFFSPDNVAPSLVALVTRPTLVIYHLADTFQFGASLFAALTAAPAKERITLTGGTSSGCGYHLFNGLDAEFVAATTGFIDKYNPGLFVTPPAGAALAVEFYNASLDHYFLTHIANEIALLDAGVTLKGWARTGQSFYIYPGAQVNSSPVCRYYIPPDKGNSHFYGRGTSECTATGAANPTFVNEDPQFFHVLLPAAGVCPAGTRNVYRTFSNRADANHRYMVDPAIRDLMVTKGWLAEGDGPDLVVMCSPV